MRIDCNAEILFFIIYQMNMFKILYRVPLAHLVRHWLCKLAEVLPTINGVSVHLVFPFQLYHPDITEILLKRM